MTGIANMVFANRTPPAASGPSDPYWSNVELLITGGQSNGSTTVVDSSSNGYSTNYNGGVSYSNAVTKFASTSLYFPGGTDDVVGWDSDTYTNLQVGNGDWTWEGWLYLQTGTTYPTFFGYGGAGSALFYIYDGGTSHSNHPFRLELWNGTTGVVTTSTTNQTDFINTWHHWAVTRDGNNYRIFKNGTQVNTTYVRSNNINRTGANFKLVLGGYKNPIDSAGTGNYWKGYMEQIRFTKGIARYTSNFTAPTAAFPTQG